MKPVLALSNTLSKLLAADTSTLANATAMKVALIIAPFTPSIDREVTDLTLASASPLAPVAAVAGTQEDSADPLTGELIVEIKPPAGGFRWNTGTGFSGPVTVYGFALTNGGLTALWGTESLLNPVILTGDNQSIEAPELAFRIDPSQIN